MSWKAVRLEKICDVIRGVTFKPEDLVPPFSDNSIVVMRTKNVQVKGLDYEDLISIPLSLIKNQKKVLIDGDLLISSANSWYLVGKTSFFETNKLASPVTAGGFISIIRPKASIKSKYLYHWLTTEKSQHKIRHFGRQTTNISNLDFSQFKTLEIPLPPLPEQQRIANILDKAEAITQKREQALALCDEFLRATFLDMFGDPVSNPKGWVYEKLDEVILSIKAGKSLAGDSKPANENELGVLKVSAVSYGFFQPQENKKIEKVVDKEKLIFPKKGDFLFSRANTRELVGATCIVQDDFEHVFLPDKLWLIDVNSEKVLAYYLHFLMLEPKFKDKLTSQATGTSGSMLNISQKKFVNTIAPIPPIELQEKFSNIVKKVNAIKARIQQAQELPLFDALSQQAFKGELTQ